MIKLITICILICGVFSQGVMRPLNYKTMKSYSLERPFESTYEGYPDTWYQDSDVVQYNDNGDFALVLNDDDSDYKMRVGFYNFKGELQNKYVIENMDGYNSQGNNGVAIARNDGNSILLVFSAELNDSSVRSGFFGILGLDGQWQRGGPIEIFHDTQDDEGALEDQFNEFRRPTITKSGNTVYFTMNGYQNLGELRQVLFNTVDLSGDGNLSVSSNLGEVITYQDGGNQETTEIYESNCIDMNNQGLVVCVMKVYQESEDEDLPNNLYLIKFDQGTFQSIHLITYENIEQQRQLSMEPGSYFLARIPDSTEFILYTNEDGCYEDTCLRAVALQKFDVNDLDTKISYMQYEPFKNLHFRENQGNTYSGHFVIVTPTQGYIFISEEHYNRTYMQEFNPQTLEVVSPLVLVYNYSEYTNSAEAAVIHQNGRYKLGIILRDDDDDTEFDISLLDLQNIDNCDDLDVENWRCLQCAEGYKLTYQLYCIEGEGISSITLEEDTQDYLKPYQLPEIEDIDKLKQEMEDIDGESANIIKFGLVLLTVLAILI